MAIFLRSGGYLLSPKAATLKPVALQGAFIILEWLCGMSFMPLLSAFTMKKLLKKILEEVKTEYGVEFNFGVEYPRESSHGHFSSNFALVLAKATKANPRDMAEQVRKSLEGKSDYRANFTASVAGPGFINFRLTDSAILGTLEKVAKDGPEYGQGQKHAGKKVMVEYAQPNPFKSFHIGHLRNVVIGESLARILENAGAEVIRTNYQGDVGLHVAKCFYGMQKNPLLEVPETIEDRILYLAKCYVFGAAAYKEDETAREEIHELNKKVYAMDPEVAGEWQEKRKWSLDKFEQIFSRVDSRFDRYYFESEMFKTGLEKAREALAKGIFIEDDNCLVFPGEKHGLNRRVFVNKLGIPTYEGKELGLAMREFTDFGNLDRVIHVVANEQINFFKVTFLAEKLLEPELIDDKQYHLSYGLVTLKGGKMSSREGNVILGEAILDAAKEEIKKLLDKRGEEMEESERESVSENVALAAVKYSFLKISTLKDMVFDVKDSIRMEGQSGPYVLYGYVRAVNILKKAGEIKKQSNESGMAGKLSDQERALIYEISKFEELAENISENYQLAILADYSYSLANAFSQFYDACQVLNENDEDIRAFRLTLVTAFKTTIGRCLDLMGIRRIEKM